VCRYFTFEFIEFMKKKNVIVSQVGLYKLNPADPELDSAWYQPLNL
jgi:hypothetical protein